MILFTLRCGQGHEFDGWFRDGDGFERQRAGGEIACPECGDGAVDKAVMAPRLGRSRDAKPPAMVMAEMRRNLREMRRQIETNCDYVGNRFAEEARKIHNGETDPRGIYGEATEAESKALTEDGISFGQIPWLPPNDA